MLSYLPTNNGLFILHLAPRSRCATRGPIKGARHYTFDILGRLVVSA